MKDKFRRSGRYDDRAEKVTARIVNKLGTQCGETEGEKEVTSPHRNLPLGLRSAKNK
jgi:hypothetical protein